MISRGPSVQQITHELMCAALRTALRSAVDTDRDDLRELDSMGGRAIAALYMIMMSHPVDRRGRCRSCRRPGALVGRRSRRCRVYGEANVWLHQPTEFLRSQLARELGLDTPPPVEDTTPGHHRPPPPAMAALTTLAIGGGYALGLLAATTRTITSPTGGVA